jgi:vitamin B12 transporter
MQKEPTSLPFFGKTAVVAVSLSFALCSSPPASAQSNEEMDILRMIYKDQDLVTPTRSPKPISQVAENITVIDADDIEAINAHTLAEVLWHVTGIQVEIHGGPGTIAYPQIQGSDYRHVRLLVDGINYNNLADSFPDIAAFPVQHIERIEIIKGPASSAWGSSLGGVINVITKSPDAERRFGGSASASIGERNTGDYRAELSGTTGRFGYYIFGGGLTSDGLTRNTGIDKGDIYTKLTLDPTRDSHAQFTLGYHNGTRGDGPSRLPDVAFSNNFEYFFSTLSLNYNLSDSVNLDLSGRVSKRKVGIYQTSGLFDFNAFTDELTAGGSAKLSWQKGPSNLLMGADYDKGTLDSKVVEGGSKNQVRWALYANDTFTFGDLSVTPGVRYDHTSTNGDFWSPSLGITYNLFDKTVFRAYGARGFSIPPLFFTYGLEGGNENLKMEKVWSVSAGVETSVARYLWLKATYFFNYINDYISAPDGFNYENVGNRRRQGVETEVRTVPFWNTSLMAGFTFISTKDIEEDRVVKDIPRQVWDVGIDYDNEKIVRGVLRGHYIWWNASSDPLFPEADARYKAMIWDLNLSRSIFNEKDLSMDIFFTAHNLFKGSQYSLGIFPNPGRWFEGGVRCRF